MTNTYDTSNEPLGSTAVKVLYNNASNLDDAVNSTERSWVDRPPFQRLRKTLSGMELDFQDSQEARETIFNNFLLSSGYEDLGDYAAGITITAYNQVFRKDGELYGPAASTELPYTTTGVWGDESSKFVSRGDFALRQDLAGTATDKGSVLVGNARKCINASQWGCVAGADISTALQGAANTADLLGWELVMDIPNAIVTGDLVLPQFFNGADCIFTGVHTFIHRARKHARAHSFTCSAMLSSGVWHSQFENINVTARWTIDGYEANWGTFWNTFKNIRCGQIRLNVQYQAVNQNNFLMCLGNDDAGYGVLITDEGSVNIGAYSDAVPLTITSYSQYFIKDAVAYSLKKQYALPFTTTTWAADSAKFVTLGIQEAHNNVFQGCDVSHSGGFYNEVAVRRQVNHIIGGYAEHGAQIIGPWNTFGVNIDGSSPPLVTSRNHVIGQTDQSLATMGDSLSASYNNIAIGGDWQTLDSSGKPPCFSASFAATVQGTLTPTPWGYTGRYGGTFTGSFQYINLKFTSSTGKFSAVIFMEFPTGELPVGLIVDDGTAQSFRTPTECVNEGNGRYLYRISGGCVPNVECTVQFLLTGGTSETRTAFIGAAFVSANKAALMPMFPVPRIAETSFSGGVETKRGQKSQSYVSGGPSFDVSVTYGAQFLASNIGCPSISLMPSSAYRGNASKYEILTATISGFTARVYYTGEWAGDIFWRA